MDQDPNATGLDGIGVLDDVFDRSQMKSGARVGLVFISPLGVRMRYMI
jgi:hypothetical protein